MQRKQNAARKECHGSRGRSDLEVLWAPSTLREGTNRFILWHVAVLARDVAALKLVVGAQLLFQDAPLAASLTFAPVQDLRSNGRRRLWDGCVAGLARQALLFAALLPFAQIVHRAGQIPFKPKQTKRDGSRQKRRFRNGEDK